MTRIETQLSSDTFDYVVIGGGSAGCVLANRLSADPANAVCLLESGPDDRHPLIHIPVGFIALFNHPVLNWRFSSTPQPHSANRTIYVPRGRVLGGTSAINGMVYVRGHPKDYDDWAAAGNAGWTYSEVLPYFKRSENNRRWRDSPFHGTDGPLNVSDHRRTNKMGRVLIEAAESLHFPHNTDFNAGERQEGFGFRQVTQLAGRRQSAAVSFLEPARQRRNLTVKTGCSVHRVVLKEGRAVGVEVRINGDRTTVRAAREVIVCAGTIGSPTLLLRSGIGDGDELHRQGIEVHRHLPGVGRNLQDHACIGIDVSAPRSPSYGLSPRAIPRLACSLLEYAFARSGLLASNIVEAGGFVRTQPGLDRPNLSYTFMSAHRNPGGRLGVGHGYALVAQLLRPASRGRITLAGPDAAPSIDLGCLADDRDIEDLLRGLKLGRQILSAPAFTAYKSVEELPGPRVGTDDQLRSYIRQYCATAFHAVGTCRMGRDEMAVVDPALRVHGVEGLRVVDASVMPTIIGGNTNAPTIMIAEKAADLILARAPPAPQLDR